MLLTKMKIRFLLPFAVMFIAGGLAYSAEEDKPMTLQESIEIALKENLVIRSAQEGLIASESQKNEAFTGLLPKLSTSYSYTRLNDAPSFMFPGIPPNIPAADMTTGTRDNYTWALEMEQPVFAGGAIIENYEVNKIGVQISSLEERARTLDIIEQVTEAYYVILKSERILGVARQAVEQLNSHQKSAQGFFDVHMIPRNDLLRSEAELANAHKFLLKAENNVELAKSSFNTILQRDINTPFEVEDILDMRPFDKTLAQCLEESVQNRPEIKAYELKGMQSKKFVKIAKSEYYPSVNAIAHFERYGDEPDVSGSEYKDEQSWYVSGVATWNLWEWGKTKDRVRASMSRANQADYALAFSKDQVRLEVKKAWLDLKDAEKQVQVGQKVVEQTEEGFRLSQERFREQLATSTDVLDAQTLLTQAKSDYANALGDYNISLARLTRAIGGMQ